MANHLTNTFASKLIPKLYLQEEFADVKLAFKENGTTQFLPAHKNILANGSEVFRAMFFGSIPEGKVVNIVDASYEEFKEFLQFFYLSEVKLTMANTEGVAGLADKYDMLECLNTCPSFLESQLTNDNMLWGYQLAVSLENEQLKKFCEKKIKYSSLETLKSEAFLECNKEILQSFLQMNELSCNEVEIFDACIEWAKRSCQKKSLSQSAENLKEQLGECFYLIRFGGMTSEEIGRIMANPVNAKMFSHDEVVEALCSTTTKNFTPKKFSQKPRVKSFLSFEANKNPIMSCVRRQIQQSYTLQIKNVDYFSASFPNLLGQVEFGYIYYNHSQSLDFTLKIIEESSSENLYTERITLKTIGGGNGDITLLKPVVIKPAERYQICLEWHRHDGHYTSVQPSIKFASLVSNTACGITFHSAGPVKAIHFKRI